VNFDVALGGFCSMLSGVLVVAVCQVRMVRGFFVVATLVVLGCLMVMTGCVCVVFRCVLVMLCCFLGHRLLLWV
jgi:hypothetical protein